MILAGDLFDVLPTLEAESIHAVVTDPPYGIGFMGKEWDSFKPEVVKGEFDLRQRAEFKDGVMSANIKGRKRIPAASPSQIQYDRGLEGQRGFQAWTERWAREVLRVLKPGAYILVCGAPRSFHRMTCGLEDAGFEVRDCLSWLYGSGFPKSLNVGCRCAGESSSKHYMRRVSEADRPAPVQPSQAADEVLHNGMPEQGLQGAGAEGHSEIRPRERVGEGRRDVQTEQGERHRPEVCQVSAGVSSDGAGGRVRDGAPVGRGQTAGTLLTAVGGGSPSGPQHQKQPGRHHRAVRQQRGTQTRGSVCQECGGLIGFDGSGTALKPGWEPIVLGRKPMKSTVMENLRTQGCGVLNIDACRVDWAGPKDAAAAAAAAVGYARSMAAGRTREPVNLPTNYNKPPYDTSAIAGRWPANAILDEEAAAILDKQSGELVSGANPERRGTDTFRGIYSKFEGQTTCEPARGAETGGASRFYYVAKPSREERDFGTDGLPLRQQDASRKEGNPGGDNPRNRGLAKRGNFHPTVKPVELMRWLVKLIVPPGGTCLDPFLGSGTTGMACRYEHREFIGIEKEPEYVQIAQRRIAAVAPLFREVSP